MDNKEEDLTWSQAIEKAIIQLGYIATLRDIHKLAPTFKSFTGLTPDRTINERVQRDSNFVKIKPGLYALKNHLDKLPDEYNPLVSKSPEEEDKITHSYIQGLLIEIGNFQKFKTFSPDKGSKFLNKKLNDIITQKSIPDFTYEKILNSTRFIDVIWFNERMFPDTIFEVENSTNFRNSLVKFVELQDFKTNMIMIAPNEKSKIEKYQQEIEKSAFSAIKDRVSFYDYDYIIKMYNAQKAVSRYSFN